MYAGCKGMTNYIEHNRKSPRITNFMTHTDKQIKLNNFIFVNLSVI